MDRIKRNERLIAMAHTLVSSPNHSFPLSHFSERFGSAKSTISEDIDILENALSSFQMGKLYTVSGASGGVYYRSQHAAEYALSFVTSLCEMLSSADRLLPGSFLYMSDILSNPDYAGRMGEILAAPYYAAQPEFVLTMETRGIPVAMMTARALHVPLVIARRENSAYEGPGVNIHYLAGNGRVETMVLSRRSVGQGKRALIIDDFMRGGGTARGMLDLMREFGVEVVGIGVVVMQAQPEKKRVQGVRSLMCMQQLDEECAHPTLTPAAWLTEPQ